MKRTRNLCLGIAATLASSMGLAQNAAPRPNIVYILADDLGYGDVGCYGQTKIHTPNLDRLAADGLRFTDYYAGAPVCAPSRCVLLTGKHTGHARVRANGPAQVQRLLEADVTFAQVLQQTGYDTGCVGKWGLGAFGDAGSPLAKGFDHFFGYTNQSAAHFYYPTTLDRDGKTVTLDENAGGKHVTYSHDLFTADAVSYISQARQKPFFLYVAYTIPHAELLVPQDSLQEYAGKWPETPFAENHYGAQPQPNAARAAMITRMDRDIGTILQKLKDLKLEDSTLVIFTSDNGPAKAGGADPAFFNSGGPFRGLKFTLNEGGIREPMIARWPGKIAAGRTTNLPSAFEDVFPTLVELAGGKCPAGLDGVSFVPTLLGNDAAQQKRPYLYWEYEGAQAVRMGDYKAISPAPGGNLQLFDLKADPGEARDIAAAHPEMVAKAKQCIAEAHVDDPNWPLAPSKKVAE